MLNTYKNCLKSIEEMNSAGDKVSYLTSILRSILQTTSLITLELVSSMPEHMSSISSLKERFETPSDGFIIQILNSTIPIIRSTLATNFINGWYETTNSDMSISAFLISWVEFRNKKSGHGVSDLKTNQEWAPKLIEWIKIILDSVQNILPVLNNTLSIPNFGGVKLSVPCGYGDKALVILSIKNRKGKWKLSAQELCHLDAREIVLDLDDGNIISLTDDININNKNQKFKFIEVDSKSIWHNLPSRQTEVFTGRGNEMRLIQQWWDDNDSRVCLIHGDGGIGKTTLTLEILHQLIEGLVQIESTLPTLIVYYTYKQNKWTENGLQYFPNVSTSNDECVRELVRFFHPILGSEWYKVSANSLIEKAKTITTKEGFKRDDILLIVDNTESMASDKGEIKELGDFIYQIGRKLCKVIITSRRRETSNATIIPVEGLTEAESVSLMKALSKNYKAVQILSAGEAKIRVAAKKLHNKPLLIDALIKYLARNSAISISNAIDILINKADDDLLLFLYEDAWLTISEIEQKVFIILIRISVPIDNTLIRKVCSILGISLTEFEQNLFKTYFCDITDYQDRYFIEFVKLAKNFFESKYLKHNEKENIDILVKEVDKYAIHKNTILAAFQNDRVYEAFKSDFAKAARVSADSGDIKSAIEYFKYAIEEDPLNVSLFERFSWFLFNKTNYIDEAEKYADLAIKYEPKNVDALITKGLILYKKGKLTEGDEYINHANKYGRSELFCLLRKGIARYVIANNNNNSLTKADRLRFISEAISFLSKSARMPDDGDNYYPKNISLVNRYLGLAKNLNRNLMKNVVIR